MNFNVKEVITVLIVDRIIIGFSVFFTFHVLREKKETFQEKLVLFHSKELGSIALVTFPSVI